MARKKSKFCTSCEMTFMGNHVCTGLNRKVLYDDPVMLDIVKGVVRGPDSGQTQFDLPEPGDVNNSGGI